MSLWDTLVAKPLSYAAAYNPASLLFAAALPGVTAAQYRSGVESILTGRVDTPGVMSYGDAARQTLDYFTPDYVYVAPSASVARNTPGTQAGNVLPQGLIPDKLEAPLKGLLIVAAIAGAAVLASR